MNEQIGGPEAGGMGDCMGRMMGGPMMGMMLGGGLVLLLLIGGLVLAAFALVKYMRRPT